MRRFLSALAVCTLSSAAAFAQAPAIGIDGVLPAATYARTGFPNGGIAQGSFFTIFGTNLGPATGTYAAAGAFPTSVAGTSVSFNVNGTITAGLIYYTSADQINGVLPSSAALGTGTATVTYNGTPSATAPVTVVTSNFGAFTQNASGTGPVDAQAFLNNTYTLTTLLATAKPGGVEILYGTGLGPNPGGDQNSSGVVPQSNLLSSLDFHLYVGGVDATSSVTYAGRTAYVGLDQINFVIPTTAPTGCYVPVVVRIGSVVSNFGTISTDPNGATCSDPYGLTTSQISQATTGQLSVASLLLTRLAVNIGLLTLTEDNAEAKFYQFDGTNYYYNPEHLTDFIGLSSFGSCQITSCANTSTCVPSTQSLSVPHLDAGAALSVSSPTVSVPKQTDGFYSAPLGSYPVALPGFPATPDNYLQPGTFTFTGPGGTDISAFSASIAVPAPLAFTTSPALAALGTVSRSSDLTFNWAPGSSSDYVVLSVTSATDVNTIPAGQVNSSTITCLPNASAGTFTIPSWLLTALPASSTVTYGGLGNVAGGAVLAGIFNVSNTFTSNANVSIANSIVLNGLNATLK